MQTIKSVIATLGCLGLLAIIGLAIAGRWFSANQDEVAEGLVEFSGMRDAKCGAMEAEYRRSWDHAVDNDTLERDEFALERLRSEIDRLCKAK